ncbi:MAG: YIP1 family protein [Deltaproteobacteria bacterium]|nr:YIP1 family protein [Deltaproteobacteria bacterium]
MVNADGTNPSTIDNGQSTIPNRFTLGFYFQVLTRMLSSPGRYFGELPERTGFGQPLGFLMISSLFFAGASLTTIHENQVLMGGILFVNAFVMPMILAGISYMVMTMSIGKRVAFERLFSVYAFAAGVTLLASWIPLFVWITEPWKWILVVVGMVKGCGFKWTQAILIAAASILILVLLFWSVSPLMVYLKN